MIPIAILAIEDDDDREFMTSLFLNYRYLMYSEIKKMISDDWTAEDILQDAVIKLVDKISLLKAMEKRRLISYVITTVKNLCKNYYRDNSKSAEPSLDDEDSGLYQTVESGDNIENAVLLRDQLRRLNEIWPQLTENSRILLELKYILFHSDKEIAADLSINPSSVRMMLTRARREAYLLMIKDDNDAVVS